MANSSPQTARHPSVSHSSIDIRSGAVALVDMGGPLRGGGQRRQGWCAPIEGGRVPGPLTVSRANYLDRTIVLSPQSLPVFDRPSNDIT
jgi:hypothetical protein